MHTYGDKKGQNDEVASAGGERQQGAVTLADQRDSAVHQRRLQDLADGSARTRREEPVQRRENSTGLPDDLKAGIEHLSGYSMDAVKVHYNSASPAQMQAHAYAQGTDIHLAPGQERHLPHEAWHVVQQAQGRVRPTMQMKAAGVQINDDAALEHEADVMGARALAVQAGAAAPPLRAASIGPNAVQRVRISGSTLKAFRRWAIKDKEGEDAEQDYSAALKWFQDATQLDNADLTVAMQSEFEKFASTWLFSATPADVTSDMFLGKGPAQPKAAEDPIKEVDKKLRGRNLEPKDFTGPEKLAIWSGKSAGWDAAITSINQQRLDRIQAAALVLERTAKYSAAKAVGDAQFAGGLVRDVWNLSYAIAISGNAGANTTLSTAHADGLILAAGAIWDQHANIVPGALAIAGGAATVSNMHVAGAPNHMIQDKSTRPVNPDPDRGRQADFICHWGGVSVNVHVDSTVPH